MSEARDAFKAASAVSRHPDALDAVNEATTKALDAAQCDSADWALLFASVSYHRDYPKMLARAQEVLKTKTIIGCSAAGILTEKGEINGAPVVAVLTGSSPNLRLEPFALSGLERFSRKTAEEILSRLPSDATSLVIFPDVFKLNPEAFFGVFNDYNRGASKPLNIVGGAPSSESPALGTFQFAGDHVMQGGVSGFFLCGEQPVHVGVTQACQPVTTPMTITACEGQWILELDGKPAFQVLKEKVPAPLLEDLRRLITCVFLAIPASADAPLDGNHYLVRNIGGIDPVQNVIACGGKISKGMSVAFALRSGDGAREHLKHVLRDLRREYTQNSPRFGMYFNCCARGESLYGIADIDTSYITQEFKSCPLIGLSSFAEIAPVEQEHHLHAYTGVLMLA